MSGNGLGAINNGRVEKKQEKFNQEELAFQMSVSRQTISKWESGETKPNAENIKLLCKIFKVEANFFFEGKASEPVAEVEEIAISATENKMKLFYRKRIRGSITLR